jgi:hypothetical protein
MIVGVRACMLTIQHYVTNTTDSQNAGALPLGEPVARKLLLGYGEPGEFSVSARAPRVARVEVQGTSGWPWILLH